VGDCYCDPWRVGLCRDRGTARGTVAGIPADVSVTLGADLVIAGATVPVVSDLVVAGDPVTVVSDLVVAVDTATCADSEVTVQSRRVGAHGEHSRWFRIRANFG
jgi:hypothetical protein